MSRNGNGKAKVRARVETCGTRWITDPVSSQTGACIDRPNFNATRAPARSNQDDLDHKIPANAARLQDR
jgi:hypothetical protein